MPTDKLLYYYGDPMIQHMEGAMCCLVCKRVLDDQSALDEHLASAAHAEKVSAAIANGSLAPAIAKLEPPALARALNWAKAAPAIAIGHIVRMILQSVIIIDAFMWLMAPRWPAGEAVPPRTVSDSHRGAWSMQSRGVELRECIEPGKGKGIFALDALPRGRVVAVYIGEPLSQRAKALRHGAGAGSSGRHFCRTLDDHLWPDGQAQESDVFADPRDPAVVAYRAAAAERANRLGKLTAREGAPIGGANNHGAYCFRLLPDHVHYPEQRVAFVDAEDPSLSSWARYVNRAPDGTRACNCVARVDGLRARVWLETKRAVAAGEELHFCYAGSLGDVSAVERLLVRIGRLLERVALG